MKQVLTKIQIILIIVMFIIGLTIFGLIVSLAFKYNFAAFLSGCLLCFPLMILFFIEECIQKTLDDIDE